jgi:hypothetical protein
MARIGKNLNTAHLWTPPWWGNDKLPRAEQFVLVVRPVTMGESHAFTTGTFGEGDERGKAILDAIRERVVEVRNLLNDAGEPVTDVGSLLDMLTGAEFKELSTVIFSGVTESEGNA